MAHSSLRSRKAIEAVNDLLHLDADITLRGDEVKCWTHDAEGGRSKTYLSREQCIGLAIAFRTIAEALK